MEETNSCSFMPKIAIAPGETIKENMEYMDISYGDMCNRMELTKKQLEKLLSGEMALTIELAKKLEDIIGPSCNFWLRLENNYRETQTRLRKEANYGNKQHR